MVNSYGAVPKEPNTRSISVERGSASNRTALMIVLGVTLAACGVVILGSRGSFFDGTLTESRDITSPFLMDTDGISSATMGDIAVDAEILGGSRKKRGKKHSKKKGGGEKGDSKKKGGGEKGDSKKKGKKYSKNKSTSNAPSPDIPEPPPPPAEHWPGGLYKMGGVLPGVLPGVPAPQGVPTNTVDAAAEGWVKIDEPCNPLLGEEWLYGGERAQNISASVYFTPEVGDDAGVLSAIEVQYYGAVEENLVGTYFSEAKESNDGPYHSLSVALRNGEAEDLCDTGTPATPGNNAYVMISPGMASKLVPLTEDSPDLISDWKEGSCIRTMGYHWIQDVKQGADLTYKAENFVPIVPMYSSKDGTINGIFFMATSRKQYWPEGCPLPNFAPCALCGTILQD